MKQKTVQEKQQVTEENKTSQTDKTETAKEIKKTITINWVWVAVVLLLLLNAAWFWLWQQQQKNTQGLQADLNTMQQKLAVTDELQTQLQQQAKQYNDLKDNEQQLSQQLAELKSQQSLSSADIKQKWTLAEVEYLLNMANQRAALARDVPGAEQALTLADEALKSLGDYRLQPLREKISDDKLALASVAKIDVAGISATLQSAIGKVDSLRVVSGPEVKAKTDTAENQSSVVPASWRQAVDGVWQKVRSLVVIRHKQDGTAAVMVPEQRYFLYQNLHLKLETARFALLTGNTEVYQASLQSAIDWLNQYFVGDDRDAIRASLQDLQNKKINLTMPDISDSLRWIQGFEQ